MILGHRYDKADSIAMNGQILASGKFGFGALPYSLREISILVCETTFLNSWKMANGATQPLNL